jgi:tetratricopeptide (TPR) repeat protein
MKQKVMLLIIIVFLSVSLYSVISHTLTLEDSTITGELARIRNIVSTNNSFLNDELYTTWGPNNRNEPEEKRDSNFELCNQISWLVGYLTKAMFGSTSEQDQYIGYIINGYYPSNPAYTPHDGLDSIYFDAADIVDFINYFKSYTYNTNDTGSMRRTMELYYLTVQAASLLDCMYYYPNLGNNNKTKLRAIINQCITLFRYMDIKYNELAAQNNRYYWGLPVDPPSYDLVPGESNINLPRYYMIQDRLQLCTAMGYAALILRKDAQNNMDTNTELDMNNLLTTVNYMLKTLPIYVPDDATGSFHKTGLLDFHTYNSGGYFESLAYLDFIMVCGNPYFTTLARLPQSDTLYYNYYDNEYIKSWINDAIDKTTPYLGDWAYNDTNYKGFGSVKYVPPSGSPVLTNSIINGIANCHYYTSDTDLKSKCSWYINSRKVNNHYPGIMTFNNFNNFLLLYLSNPDQQITGAAAFPESYTDGSYINSEFGIIRKAVSDTLSLVNNPAMYITYKNSMNSWHNHADQTSFSFFYKGKQFFIDPGYKNDYPLYVNSHTWMQTPYAHNMIVVDPWEATEKDELQYGYWNPVPVSDYDYGDYLRGSGNYYNHSTRPTNGLENTAPTSVEDMYKSQAFRLYNTSNGETDLLQTWLRYDYTNSVMSQSNPYYVDLTRSYIRDGDLFFIYDDLSSHIDSSPATPVSKTYWNLLQTGIWTDDNSLYPDMIQYDNSNMNLKGVFCISKGSPLANRDCIDIATGSNLPHRIYLDNGETDSYWWSAQPYFDETDEPYKLPSCNHIYERVGGSSSAGDLEAPDPLKPNDTYHKGTYHARIRTRVINGINPKFLTIIAPRKQLDDSQLITRTINTPEGHYGTWISSKSHTPASTDILCTTYSGCSNGESITIPYTTSSEIQTNGKFYLLTRPYGADSAVVDNSLVVINGSFIKFNDTPVYNSFSTGILSMSASYLNHALHVEFNSTQAQCPKFKISRSGVLPEHFTARLSYSLNDPPAPGDPSVTDIRFNYIIDVITILAYDDTYFYVNYSLDDLVMAGLLTDSLFIYKGDYACPSNWAVLQFNGPDITLSGEWFVPEGSRLSLLGNNNIHVSPDFRLSVDGIFEMQGASESGLCQLTENDTTAYMQLVINPEGHVNFANAKIENAAVLQIRGSIECYNFYLNHCETGLMLLSNREIYLEDVLITHCDGYGMVLQNIWPDGCNGKFEDITISHNKYGLFLYNSSPLLERVFIADNDYAGLMCMRNSHPFVTKSSINNTYIHDQVLENERPEVSLYEDCFPALVVNDIIFGDGYSLFSYDSNPAALNCPDNYWGTLDEETIRQSFFPPLWEVNFMPILTESIMINNAPTLITGYFVNAVGFEKLGDFTTASNMYKTIIENYPTSQEAPESASRLVCIAQTEAELLLAKNYLDDIYELYPSTHLANAAYLDSKLCDRLMEEYSEAIAGYQERLEDDISYLDSLLTQLDIVYTYLEAAANGTKAMPLGVMCMGEPLVSSKRAKELEAEILNTVLNQPYPGENFTHVPDVITATDNYPNPFNPTTTIRFSIPKQADCELAIYNIKGQAVKHVLRETKSRGMYKLTWDSKDDKGSPVASGVYFYRLKIDSRITTKKMMLMK